MFDLLKPILLILIIFIHGTSVRAQLLERSYLKGVIEKLNGEKINALIEQKLNYSGKIRYKVNSKNKPLKISAKEIHLLKIGEVTYARVIYKSKPFLMKEIITGPLSLYSVSLPDISTPSIPDDNRYGNYEYYIVKDNKTHLIPKEGFNRVMSELVSDHIQLAQKVLERFYTYGEIIGIVSDYNYWYHYTRKAK